MREWEKILEMRWPTDQCDRSGECCRGAAQIAPWKNILRQAAQGDLTARAFLSQYTPYPDKASAEKAAPYGVEASLEIAASRGDNLTELIFYHCRYLSGQSDCQIYEDRPALCREFPESPFGAIPRCCGYHPAAQNALGKIEALRQQLRDLKNMQAMIE